MMRHQSKPIACIALAALAVLFSACSSVPWGTVPANPDRVELNDDFNNGDTRLDCQLRCALTWGFKRDRVKALYDAKAWKDVAIEVLRIGYGDDLSYFYLGKAAEGLGYYHAAGIYFRLSRQAVLKCADIYGECYGLVFARDARLTAPPAVRNNLEPKGQYAMAPKTKEPSIAVQPSIPSPPAAAEPGRRFGYGANAEYAYQPTAIEPAKRATPSATKKPPEAKPVQQSDASPPPKDETSASAGSVNENKSAAAGSKPAPNVGFAEIREKFGGRSRLTEEQKREEWKKYQGRCVEWDGELSYVGDSFIRGLTLGFKHNPQTLTYDVLVSAPHDVRDAALHMKKGARYTYRATLKKYGGPILPISVNWGCGTEPRATDHAKAD